MNPTGIVILIAGAWVTCQVLGGNALGRLGIIPNDANTLPNGLPSTGDPDKDRVIGGIPPIPNPVVPSPGDVGRAWDFAKKYLRTDGK